MGMRILQIFLLDKEFQKHNEENDVYREKLKALETVLNNKAFMDFRDPKQFAKFFEGDRVGHVDADNKDFKEVYQEVGKTILFFAQENKHWRKEIRAAAKPLLDYLAKLKKACVYIQYKRFNQVVQLLKS